MRDEHKTMALAVGIGVAAVVGVLTTGYFLDQQYRTSHTTPPAGSIEQGNDGNGMNGDAVVPPVPEGEGVMCTMDAKICPDGSSVGRSGPNCEFAPCPGEEAGQSVPGAASGNSQLPSITEQTTVTKQANGWTSYSTEGFSISAPEFEFQDDGTQAVKLLKFGPSQRRNTEMYDGILMMVSQQKLTEPTLSQYVDGVIQDVSGQGIGEITEGKKPVAIGSYSGFTFEESGLGTFRRYFVQNDSKSPYVIEIVSMVNDPSEQGYVALNQQVLSTLEIKQ